MLLNRIALVSVALAFSCPLANAAGVPIEQPIPFIAMSALQGDYTLFAGAFPSKAMELSGMVFGQVTVGAGSIPDLSAARAKAAFEGSIELVVSPTYGAVTLGRGYSSYEGFAFDQVNVTGVIQLSQAGMAAVRLAAQQLGISGEKIEVTGIALDLNFPRDGFDDNAIFGRAYLYLNGTSHGYPLAL